MLMLPEKGKINSIKLSWLLPTLCPINVLEIFIEIS